MADELGRWAAARARELRRRAEEEAVAVLRDALVRAALAERGEADPGPAAPAPPRDPKPTAAPKRTGAPKPTTTPARPPGKLLWAYCVIGAAEPMPEGLGAVDPDGPVERVVAGGLAALVSRVPARDFAAEPLRENLNDIEWLERVARAHEDVLERALAVSTIVPLRLCTLYENQDGVRRMLQDEHETLAAALEQLDGRQEWGVKVLVDPDALAREARDRSAEARDHEEDLAGQSAGGAYMLRRRLERHVREVADALAADVVEDVHGRLRSGSVDAVTRPPQNRDLSGHEGEMLLNAAYLVDADRLDALRDHVTELQARHRDLGVRIDLTGPWPPYNFVPGGGAGPIA